VWSANGRDGTVSRIDRAGGSVITIPVGGEPTALAFGGSSLWVADGEAGRVDQVNFNTNRVVRRLPAGNAPRGVAVTSGAVWVSSAVDGQVNRLDLTRSGRPRTIDVAGGPAAITAGAGAVWVASEEDRLVTKLDPRSGAPVKTIGVGNAPAALAVGFGSVWVANRDDGTVTRIDAKADVVRATVPVGGRPIAVATGLGAVWVADGEGAVIRIDPGAGKPRRIPTGSAPSAVTLYDGHVWAGATASPATHRGGTLRFELAPEGGVFTCTSCIDAAEPYSQAGSVLSLAYDGLIAFRRVPGVGGITLVADLAESIPEPDDGGRTYTFQLRSGPRFSDGSPVRPSDFRASIQRTIRLGASPLYNGITGAAACTPRRCDLSAGIETDDAARTITILLREADSEFLYKLAQLAAFVLPARTPVKLLRHPVPGTGPYAITGVTPKREVRLTRNPYFHSWSSEARPDGYPDAITAEVSADGAAQVSAVQRDRSDAVIFAGDGSGFKGLAEPHAIAFADASRVHAGPAATNSYLFVNVHERPFDDPKVRQALNYAIDRGRMVEVAGGSSLNTLSCQFLPAGLPGYAPNCPYTRDVSALGRWTAPDLGRARQLVAESGTRGQRVEVLGPPRFASVARYAAKVLQRLGYRAHARVIALERYYPYIDDSRHHTQVMFFNWSDDYPTPSSFFEPFSCANFVPNSAANLNPSQFCDHALDAGVTAALAAHGADANAQWAALDRKLLAAAPAVPLFSRRMLLLVSDRVGNAQLNPTLGPLLDQFWVR
jgi:peptide/nickel transport system substrate-binding protein